MKLSLALLSNTPFASTVLAARHNWARNLPDSFPPDKNLSNTFDKQYNSAWAGVLPTPTVSNYTQIITQFMIPTINPTTSDDGYWGIAAWVGIDGYSPGTSLVHAGVLFQITVKSGVATRSYVPWYEWNPADPVYLQDDIPMSVEDNVSIQVTMLNSTTAQIVISNLSIYKTHPYNVSAPDLLQ